MIVLAYALFGLLVGIGIGMLAARLREAGRALEDQRRIATLEARLEAAESQRKQLVETFDSLAGKALKSNSEEFLKLARENLGQFQLRAQAQLAEKEKTFGELVKPIGEALKKTEHQIQQMEKERREAFGSLNSQIRLMAESQKSLQAETQNLVNALRRPEVRGQWGEMTLRRLAELAGMVDHCDFYEQEHRATEDGAMRPDMIVRMPERRELVVDAKTPLDAYLSAVEAKDETARTEHLKRHARKVRDRMKELASKSYWSQFRDSPDFVILFIPGEQFLTAALDQDPALLEDALSNRVILATPTTLVALLRAVAFGWRQQQVADNAEEIRNLGEDLFKRVTTFAEHLAKVGRALDQSVGHYNKAVGSLERQVLPGARKFTELGIHSKKAIPELDPIEQAARRVEVGDDNDPSTDGSSDDT